MPERVSEERLKKIAAWDVGDHLIKGWHDQIRSMAREILSLRETVARLEKENGELKKSAEIMIALAGEASPDAPCGVSTKGDADADA
jgi:hypothetical protein